MRPLILFVVITSAALSATAHAQDAAPEPTPPAASEPPPPPANPPAQVFDGEQPPEKVRHAPRTIARAQAPVMLEAPASGVGFGLEAATSGFASGNLQGGLLMGAHLPSGTLLGVRLDYADHTQKVGGESQSTSAIALGLGARFPVAGSKAGLDLAVAVDLAYVKAQTAATDNDPASGATGFQVGLGPQLRYWINPTVAVGYVVQIQHGSATSDQKDSLGQQLEVSDTRIGGAFTVTAGF
jgi:hypothetical protein